MGNQSESEKISKIIFLQICVVYHKSFLLSLFFLSLQLFFLVGKRRNDSNTLFRSLLFCYSVTSLKLSLIYYNDIANGRVYCSMHVICSFYFVYFYVISFVKI